MAKLTLVAVCKAYRHPAEALVVAVWRQHKHQKNQATQSSAARSCRHAPTNSPGKAGCKRDDSAQAIDCTAKDRAGTELDRAGTTGAAPVVFHPSENGAFMFNKTSILTKYGTPTQSVERVPRPGSGASPAPAGSSPASSESRSEPAAPAPAMPAPAAPANSDDHAGSRLVVGPNVKLKGAEIDDCDILVVEGRVEATMDSRVLRVAENGAFSGKVVIDVAEINGRFDGDLTARSQLIIHATGRVSGTIRYGKIRVEEGGEPSGDIRALSAERERPADAGKRRDSEAPGIKSLVSSGG
jgi:cytoskeletal protein CcmA (bactofilin family)